MKEETGRVEGREMNMTRNGANISKTQKYPYSKICIISVKTYTDNAYFHIICMYMYVHIYICIHNI